MHRKTLLALVGGLLLALGAVPAWIMVAPWYDGPVLAVHFDGMGSGLETFGVATLPLGVAAAGLALLTDLEGRFAWVAVAFGVLGLAVVVFAIITVLGRGPYVPGVGAIASIVGALCVIGGGVDALRDPQPADNAPSRTSA